MKYFKELAMAKGVEIKDAKKYGIDGIIVANDPVTRSKVGEMMNNMMMKFTYYGEVMSENEVLYTKR